MRIASAVAVLMIVAAGCASPRSTVVQTSLAPSMVLERFLRAANTNDLDTMASLFGTREGPVKGMSKKELDEWMFTIASVVRHSDYALIGENIVPGRRDEATALMVRLQTAGGRYEVPFLLVQSKDGWLVENVPVEQLTNRRGGGTR